MGFNYGGRGPKKGFGSKVKSFAKGLKPGGYNTTGHKQQGGLNPSEYGNPTGMTFSEAMEIYGIDNKTDLQERMKHNPAETNYFGALIDDSEKDNNTNNNTMDTLNPNQ